MARRIAGPYVLFQPGNKRTHKRGNIATSSHPKYWPPASWAAVADAICARYAPAETLVIHLGMSGRLIVRDPDGSAPGRHEHIAFAHWLAHCGGTNDGFTGTTGEHHNS